MEHVELCPVCKQPASGFMVQTNKGKVHTGYCQQMAEDLPISESADTILQETELLC